MKNFINSSPKLTRIIQTRRSRNMESAFGFKNSSMIPVRRRAYRRLRSNAELQAQILCNWRQEILRACNWEVNQSWDGLEWTAFVLRIACLFKRLWARRCNSRQAQKETKEDCGWVDKKNVKMRNVNCISVSEWYAWEKDMAVVGYIELTKVGKWSEGEIWERAIAGDTQSMQQ
jgi:hypothetical protein